MWYDIGRMLSYNKIFNFVIGNRGGGKTFNAKKWCINDYKKNGKHFVWVRRYKTEFKRRTQFFDDVSSLYPDDTFQVKGTKCYINGEEFGTFITLSTSTTEKSNPYPLVNKIIFDEFIIDKGSLRYLPNEVDVFLELYETISRLRDDVRAVFLGNAISLVNPYFLYFKIKPDLRKRFNSYEHLIVELYKNQEYIEAKKNTRFGKMIAETKYGEYAIDNDFLRDDYTFIEPFPPNCKFYCVVKYKGRFFGLWNHLESGCIHVNYRFDPYTDNKFSLTKDDNEPDWKGIGIIKRTKCLDRVVLMFETGNVRFESIEIKSQFYEFVQYLR